MNEYIQLLAEIPAPLCDALVRWAEQHPTWDQDRIFAVALSQFLLHQNFESPGLDRCYLEAMHQPYLPEPE